MAAKDRQLAERVAEMVIAANDMRDPHIMIIDNDREHIGRCAVRAQQDEIVDLSRFQCDIALNVVSNRDYLIIRRAQAHGDMAHLVPADRRHHARASDKGRAGHSPRREARRDRLRSGLLAWPARVWLLLASRRTCSSSGVA